MREEELRPEDFGAVGDGRRDDSDAFTAINRAVAEAGGGIVTLRSGAVYRVGRQRAAPPSRLLTLMPVLFARNVSHFIVRMNGATLRYNDGLKFGSFDPRSGSGLGNSVPFFEHGAAADLGYAIFAEGVAHFEVSGGTIDLNSQGATVGGEWGDTGWQLPCYGVAASDCDQVMWTDVRVENSCLDGFLYALSRARRVPMPLQMRRCSVSRVARNCVTIAGCDGALVENCRFERAGEAPRPGGQTFGSQPRSCFDVEAEGPKCRNVAIRNCDLISGQHSSTAFVADSGDTADILIVGSRLVGTIWTSKPRTILRDCEIKGKFGRLFGGAADPRDNSIIEGCRIVDRRWPDDTPPPQNVISGEGAGASRESPITVRNSTFDIYFHAPNFRWTRLENVVVTIRAGAATLQPGQYVMFLAGATVRGLRILDRIPSSAAPRVPYFVHEALSADIEDAAIESPDGRILWNASSTAAGGYTGRFRGSGR